MAQVRIAVLILVNLEKNRENFTYSIRFRLTKKVKLTRVCAIAENFNWMETWRGYGQPKSDRPETRPAGGAVNHVQ